MTMINNTVRIWATALLFSEIFILVRKIKYEFMKKVVKMRLLPEKEVKEEFNYHNQKPLINLQE